MRIPKDEAAKLGAAAFQRIAAAPLTEQQRFLLADCLEAYLPIGDREQRERFFFGEAQTKVYAMNKTNYDRALEQGLEQGRMEGLEQGLERGLRTALLRLGTKRFGRPSAAVEAQLNSIEDLTQLELLTDRVLDATSWADVLRSP
jgi:hypothetical protein